MSEKMRAHVLFTRLDLAEKCIFLAYLTPNVV
jgi:hypothetical protein